MKGKIKAVVLSRQEITKERARIDIFSIGIISDRAKD